MVTDQPTTEDRPVEARLTALTARLDAATSTTMGFPAGSDLDWSPLAPIFTRGLLNNLGDPYMDGLYPLHVKDFEREAVELLADLFRAPPEDRWGYVTGGATEGTLYGLWLARRLYPRAVVYHSPASHPSVAKAIDVLGMESVVLRTEEHGELEYQDLAEQVGRLRDRPAVVVANVGTTMTESTDDVRQILRVLDAIPMPATRRFVLADAALSGIPLALLDPADRPGFDLQDGADAVVVSGHKFLSTPMPCAAVVVKASTVARAPTVAYTGSPDTTISSSRNGHAALAIWYALTMCGRDGLATRARECHELAAYLHRRLRELGWPADPRPHTTTGTLAPPPPAVPARLRPSAIGGRSHIVCAPGVTRELLDEFLDALVDEDTAQEDTGVPATGTNGKRRLLPGLMRRNAATPAEAESLTG